VDYEKEIEESKNNIKKKHWKNIRDIGGCD
jgi:hypothetical protein